MVCAGDGRCKGPEVWEELWWLWSECAGVAKWVHVCVRSGWEAEDAEGSDGTIPQAPCRLLKGLGFHPGVMGNPEGC